METRVERYSKKRTNRTVLILVVVVLVLAASAFFAYARLDVFKSPKMIYLESEYKTLKNTSDLVSDTYGEYFAGLIRPYTEESVHSTMEVSASAELEGLMPQEQQILNLLKEGKLVIESQADQANKKQYAKTTLLLQEEPLIDLEFAVDQDKMYVGAPMIYPKYALFDLTQSQKLEEKGITGLPTRYVTYQDWVDAIKVSDEEWKPILNDYAKWYKDQLKDSQFTMNKESSVEIDGQTYEARNITLTFTEEEWKQFLTSFTETWTSDERLLSLLYSRYENVHKLLEDSGVEGLTKMTEAEWKENIATLRSDTIAEIEGIELADDVKIVMYIDGSDRILSRQFFATIPDNQKGEQAIELRIDTVEKGKDEVDLWLSLSTKGAEDAFTILYDEHLAPVETGKKGTFNLELKDQTRTYLKSDGDILLEDETGKLESTFNLEFFDEFQGNGTLSGDISIIPNQADNTRESQVHLVMASNDLPGQIELDLKQKDTFDKPVELPEFTADNTVDIAALTPEESMMFQQEITQAAFIFYQQNMGKLLPLFQ
ncbi:MAG: hypothetical protein H0Z33_13850 [Bacillaceae bacterium]|nr:hypothetical protein [Bacillaceae bacterium]